ncbi:MAG: UDP-N-acetylmuramate: L-alanyl-gamma-D-glutamyl-meso-diaminopimelate ligase [Limisphaerales bacterium]|jgi:UDP-N-acetylmuramate: L-alanyl-gamma-D-glutamyl-meso-diaminopimelate ligase
MASAAAAMKERGFVITGSDQNVYPPMSTFLSDQGIEVIAGYRAENLHHKPDLVVIGNVISRGNEEAEAVLDERLRYCSLAELLKEFFIRGKRSLVVAGTHGKTTTTSLLAWVFEHNGLSPSFLIGGIPENLGQGARFNDSEWFIIEGDEYDTAFFDKRSKFIHYLPEVCILNNLEFDHADIFEDLAAIQKSFSHLIRLVPRNGLLLANGDEANLSPLLDNAPCPVKRFGLSEPNELQATNIDLQPDDSGFELEGESYRVPMIGELNLRNALAVAACARHCGLTRDQIQSAFDTFAGIRRRMDVRGEAGGVTVIDDFGHHPTAIRETLKALRIKYGSRPLRAVFEPRSNTTRRNIFQQELVAAFQDADMVILSQVARLDQLAVDERLDPEKLMTELRASGKSAHYVADVGRIVDLLVETSSAGDVICVFSNGGFDNIHERLLTALGAACAQSVADS